jgi:hypothetical protein
MKTFTLVLMGVLVSTLLFANKTDEPTESRASVSVTNSAGSSLVKVLYKAEQSGSVKISIFNEDKDLIFSESLRSVNGFVRPYNFGGLPAGLYTVQLEDKEGMRSEQIDYTAGKIEKYVSIVKLTEPGKYLLSVNSKALDRISVNVYNGNNELIHSQMKDVEHSFAEVLNLKDINNFTIEVADSQGVLKSIRN